MKAKIILLLVTVIILVSGCTFENSTTTSPEEPQIDTDVDMSRTFSSTDSPLIKDESDETEKTWIYQWKPPHFVYLDTVGDAVNDLNVDKMNTIVSMLNKLGFINDELNEKSYADLDRQLLHSLLMQSKNTVNAVKAERTTQLYQKYNLNEPVAFLSKDYVDENIKRFFCNCPDKYGYKINLNPTYKVGDKTNYSSNYYVEYLSEDGVYALTYFGGDMDKYVSVLTNYVQHEDKYILTYVHSVATINDVTWKTEDGTVIGEKKPFNGWQIFDEKIFSMTKIDYQFCIQAGEPKLHAVEMNSKN